MGLSMVLLLNRKIILFFMVSSFYERIAPGVQPLQFYNIEISPNTKVFSKNDQYPNDAGDLLSLFDGDGYIVLLFYTITEASCKSIGKKRRIGDYTDRVGIAETQRRPHCR